MKLYKHLLQQIKYDNNILNDLLKSILQQNIIPFNFSGLNEEEMK